MVNLCSGAHGQEVDDLEVKFDERKADDPEKAEPNLAVAELRLNQLHLSLNSSSLLFGFIRLWIADRGQSQLQCYQRLRRALPAEERQQRRQRVARTPSTSQEPPTDVGLLESTPYDLYHFTLSREKTAPLEFLGDYQGHLQGDAYAGNPAWEKHTRASFPLYRAAGCPATTRIRSTPAPRRRRAFRDRRRFRSPHFAERHCR